MNRVRDLNPKRLILSAVLLLVFSVALVLFARDLIREIFVIPISYLVWVIGVLGRTTPQIVFWVAVLVIAFLWAYRSLLGRRKVYALPPPDTMELFYQTAPSNGRVSFWQIKASLLRMRTPYYHTSFHSALGRLLVDLLAYRYRLTPAQVESRLEDGTLNVPDEVREYIQSSMTRYPADARGFLARLWDTIVETVQDWFSARGQAKDGAAQSHRAAPVDPRVARILEYMKDELEVSHDNSGS